MPRKILTEQERIERRREKDRIRYYVRFGTPEKREARKKYRKENRKKNLEKHHLDRKLQYEKYKKEKPFYSTICSIRSLVSGSIKRSGFKKCKRTEEILGCTIYEFITHIESQFEPWMNWDNYGNWNGIPTEPNTAWDIDHIIPSISAKSEDEIYVLNHYTNLRPLCSYVNRYVKRDKIEDLDEGSHPDRV